MRSNLGTTKARCAASLVLAAVWAVPSIARATTASADSNITTVDTRGAQSGTLTGLVQANGAPINNAQLRIDAPLSQPAPLRMAGSR
jgi:hypothetical protein